MNERILLIEPHDPAIFRDGRPFTDGLPAKTLPFPLPATTAGAIRSRSGENLDFEDDDVIKALLRIRQIGPFAAARDIQSQKWELALPAPADAVAYKAGDAFEFQPLRPPGRALDGGCDLPEGLRPLFGARPEKAMEEAPRFWRAGFLLRWLAHSSNAPLPFDPRQIGFGALPVQRRVHVAIDPASLTAAEGMLFTTDGLEFTWPSGAPDEEGRLAVRRAGIVSKVMCPSEPRWPAVAPIGGERRLALWRELSAEEVEWPAPPELHGDLVRAVLVTPGVFGDGWKPSWCAHGRPPEPDGLELELIAAAVPRFQPVSGWDLRKGRRGPKATRFLAPAGSVYFFRRRKGNPRQLWMQSICDREEDRRDGYGIVLIGDF